jgi:2,5-diamino-6-(ribosylamino)-4(3H)-pyrimidinone 5'-phosphate reductase
MKTEIIIHNSVSLDGSLTGFMPDMELHYRIAGDYHPDAHLIGADTIIAGNDMFGDGIPEELPSDSEVPRRHQGLPWWVIVDSRGRLKGALHTCRRFEYCRDVIILASESTPVDYLDYLKERNYSFIIAGAEKTNLEFALAFLSEKYKINKILTDTGRVLGSHLINLGLVSELSVLIHPLLIGGNCYPMFYGIKDELKLSLKKSEQFDNGCVWNVYTIKKAGIK